MNAKRAVIEFLERIGYDAVDMGPLSESWRSEPTMPVYLRPYWGTKTPHESSPGDVSSFMSAPGRVVDRKEVTELLRKAVRHGEMFGRLEKFFLASK